MKRNEDLLVAPSQRCAFLILTRRTTSRHVSGRCDCLDYHIEQCSASGIMKGDNVIREIHWECQGWPRLSNHTWLGCILVLAAHKSGYACSAIPKAFLYLNPYSRNAPLQNLIHSFMLTKNLTSIAVHVQVSSRNACVPKAASPASFEACQVA